MTQPEQSLIALKQSIRAEAQARRQAQADKDRLSELICGRLAELPEYVAAGTILFYVDARAEVRTRPFLASALGGQKQIAVPYCRAGRLELLRLESLAELHEGSYRILEPRADLREMAERRVEIGRIDLAVIPGVVFDAQGGRLGHGWGYYDKLLAEARGETPRVALAFECQMFPALPADEHDVPVDTIITERAIYRPTRRTPAG